MVVESRKLNEIKPYSRNPRKISDKAIDKVAASLQEFGFRQPLVVDEAGTIIVGHTRLLAAKKLGLDQIPVHTAHGLTDAQKRAYRMADNRTGEESKWDMDLLSVEIGDLDGFDVSLTGFDQDEFAELFPQPLESLPDLPDGDRTHFQQMTFTLHDDQVEEIKRALTASKGMGPFGGPNENSNGNALARICELFLSYGHG